MAGNYTGPWNSFNEVEICGIEHLPGKDNATIHFMQMMIFDGGPIVTSNKAVYTWAAVHYPVLDRILIGSNGRSVIDSAVMVGDGTSRDMTENEKMEFSVADGWHGKFRGVRFTFDPSLRVDISPPAKPAAAMTMTLPMRPSRVSTAVSSVRPTSQTNQNPFTQNLTIRSKSTHSMATRSKTDHHK